MSQEKRPVETLVKPELDVVFKPNADGTYSVTIPLSKSASDAEIPMLRYIEKNMENLKGTLENVLVTKGVPHSVSNIPVSLNGEVGGKIGGNGNIGAETSEVERVTIGGAKGGLGGAAEISGKVGGSIKFELQPGKPGLDEKTQASMQKLLDEKVDALCLRWAQINKNGTSVPAADGTKLTVSPNVVQNYIDSHSQTVKVPSVDAVIKSVKDAIPFLHSDAGAAPAVAAAGLAAPEHSFHRMYSEAAGKLGDRPGSETLAAALTVSAANAGFDPAKPIHIAAGNHGDSVFVIQGDPSSPASKSVMVDVANPKAPTPEQVAQLQSVNGPEQPQMAAERSAPSRA